MSNIHPFPKRPTPKKARTKNPALGPEFLLQDSQGHTVDVLAHIVQAGGIFLIQTLEQPENDLPNSQLMRTIAGLDALTDAANNLVVYARIHLEGFDQDTLDQLVAHGNRAHKLVRKLYDIVPANEFILSTDSYGPDLMTEYATNAALVVTTRFALDLLATYYGPFIKTGKDKRKAMFRDFQGGFQDAHDECLARSEDHEFLIKELMSANRAMQKALREL